MLEQTYLPLQQGAEQERTKLRKENAFSARLDRAMEFSPRLQKLQMGSHFVILKGKREFVKARFVIFDDFKRLYNEVRSISPQ